MASFRRRFSEARASTMAVTHRRYSAGRMAELTRTGNLEVPRQPPRSVASLSNTPPATPTAAKLGRSVVHDHDLDRSPSAGERLFLAMLGRRESLRTERPVSPPPPYEDVVTGIGDLKHPWLFTRDGDGAAATSEERATSFGQDGEDHVSDSGLVALAAYDDEDFTGSDSNDEPEDRPDSFSQWHHLLIDDLPSEDDSDDEYTPESTSDYNDFEELVSAGHKWDKVFDSEVTALHNDTKRWAEMSPEMYEEALAAKTFFLERRESGTKGPRPQGGCRCA